MKLNPPEAIGKIMDAVSKRDREHFDEHPDEAWYVRPIVPGEFWPYTRRARGANYVQVDNLGTGKRLRTPYHTEATVQGDTPEERVL